MLSTAEREPDPRSEGSYTVAEAARHIQIPRTTLKTWIAGRDYPTRDGTIHWAQVIEPASQEPLFLSFENLIEAHVLWALRQKHKVKMPAVREALAYAERELGIKRLLLSKELKTAAGRLFLDRYGQLIDLAASGQLAMRRMFEQHLERVEWDESGVPARLYPFVVGERAHRNIVIDPRIAFGRPVIGRAGVTTQIIVERLDAGESPAEVANDYDLDPAEVEEAALYERAA